MTQEYNTELLKEVLITFGGDNQIDMMVEEASELLNALMKFKRERATAMDVLEEVADVQIMCAQMEMYFERFRGIRKASTKMMRKYKMDRLAMRLADYKDKK